jgi:hypothetical protein
MVSEKDLSPEHSRQTFPLGKAQRRFLLNGDTGSYDSKAKIRGKISEKISQLDNRIQDLIDELSLLGNHEMLHNNCTWEDINQLHIKKELQPQQISFQADLTPQNSTSSVFPEHAEFGFVMGRLISNLYAGIDGEEHYKDLMWGLTVGLIGLRDMHRDDEYEEREAVLDWLQQQSKSRYNRLFDEDPTNNKAWQHHVSYMEEMGYPLPSVRDTGSIRMDYPDTDAFDEVIDRLHNNPELEKVPEDRISKIAARLDILFNYIRADIYTIKSHSASGVIEATEVFNELYKNSNDAGDEDDESDEGDEDGAEIINKTAVALAREGHTSGYKEEYGQILTDMTGDGKDGHLFYERPLVQKRSGSSPKYELTPYGALVGYCMFSIQDIREWLHNSFFLPDTKTSSSELPDRYSTEQELIQLGLKTIGQNRDDA